MIVISDSSPLVALSRINRLDIFQQLFGQMMIPDSVYQEVIIHCPNLIEKTRIQTAIHDFIEVVPLRTFRMFSRNLGRGERGVLNLALERPPDILLIDDKRARSEAHALGLFPTFTTDVLKEAERRHLISSYQGLIEELYKEKIYLPE